MTRSVRLAVVRGDGIGTEVVEEGLKVLDAAAADVTFTTLIADPKGMGRSIDYELLTCPSQDDHRCSKDPAHTQVLARGSTTEGELAVIPNLLQLESMIAAA